MQSIIDFLEDGKAVYLESAILGTGDHAELLPYFGIGEHSTPCVLYAGIETIIADSTETFNEFSMSYLYGSNADYGIDALDADLGTPFSHSQDDAIRGIFYDSGEYRTIASSAFFGAMADGSTGNTKAAIMTQYLSFLMGDPIPNIYVLEDELTFELTFPEIFYTLELEIFNTGLDTLIINNISISGDGFVYDDLTEFELNPSEQQIVEVGFMIDETGDYSGELIIASNDPDTPELIVQLSAECVLPPSILCDPSFIDVTLISNDIHQEMLTISNSGGVDLNCELVINDSSQYTDWLEVDQEFLSIQPGGEEEILIFFNPDGLENGQYSTELVIYNNDPSQEELIIPISMTLSLTDADDDFVSTTNKLIGNYPNPFNPITTIEFSVTQTSALVTLEIYNIKGRKVKQLVNDQLSVGTHSIVWNGTDENNTPTSSGIYFYKLKAGNFQQTRKMILLK
ncbi:MAG: T9SS type A sorting domain-containing protein [Candidatus Tenebribacter mawsonii]|nr:T9SS type A sorting domain-containing protein [Candidatus Tenebribacter mawsonii]